MTINTYKSIKEIEKVTMGGWRNVMLLKKPALVNYSKRVHTCKLKDGTIKTWLGYQVAIMSINAEILGGVNITRERPWSGKWVVRSLSCNGIRDQFKPIKADTAYEAFIKFEQRFGLRALKLRGKGKTTTADKVRVV